MSPTPNTTFFREEARRGHFRQTAARACNSAMADALASRPCGAGAGGLGTAVTWNSTDAGGPNREGEEGATVAVGAVRAGCEVDAAGGLEGKIPGVLVKSSPVPDSAANDSGESETNLTPCAFILSRCWMAASSSWL